MTAFSGKLSRGSLLYNWSAEKSRDFYLRVADEMDVDRVFIGEVVCSKRQPLHEKYIAEVVERLQAAGKQVIFSTLALVMNQREIKGLKSLFAEAGDFLVEINDITLLSACEGKNFAVGSYVNIYNEDTLRFFEELGASIVSLPFEHPRSTLKILAANAKSELEVQVFGRIPLAISARCYHARTYHLHKDNCQFVCEKHLDGMDVHTMDGQNFLAINGTQTQSYSYANLVQEIPDLQSIGINNFRLSPHDADMVAIANIFRSVQQAKMETGDALHQLETLLPEVEFSNGFYHSITGRQLQLA